MRAATLTDHLSGWPDHRLERLFSLRPDLCHPPVPDFAALAARASTQMSVLRALDGLDRAHLDVLEGLAVLAILDQLPPTRPDAGPSVTLSRLASFLTDGTAPSLPGTAPDEAHLAAIKALVLDLVEAALVVEHDAGWRVPVPVAAALGPHPLSFGRTAAALGSEIVLPADREGVLTLLAREAVRGELLARTTAALEALQSSPVARVPEPPGPVHEVLLRTGLLVPLGADRSGSEGSVAEHPLEAGLAWRRGTAGRTVHPEPPAPSGRAVNPALSRNAALAAIGDLLRGAADLLEALAGGLPTLRSGGVGVRDLKRLAGTAGGTPEDVSWLLELLASAGLVVLDPDTSTWVPAATVPAWRRSERQVQWEALVAGWLSSGRAPMLGPVPPGTSGLGPGGPSSGRALAPDRNRPDAPRLRAAVLEAALEVSDEQPGTRLDEAVPDRQRWRGPRQQARSSAFTLPLLAEADRLGLVGAGALTAAGALVAAGRLDEAAAAVGAALPAALTRVRLQGDLTAVAPGYLDPDVAGRLAAMAEVEGDGAARVYRFSDASVHRALESGSNAEELEAFLEDHSEDAIPQSLRYLIRDVARRHGTLTLGDAGAWLRSDDEDLLDVIVADPALATAQLERLAPTVVVAGVGPAVLHRMLAEAGHRSASARRGPTRGPAAEGGRRTHAGDGVFPEPVRAVRWSPSEEELAAQIARLRSAPQPAPSGAGTEEAVAVLHQAARQRTEVDLVTVDQRGQRQSRRVVPLAVAGGRVRCLVPDREAETVVPLHRIVSATTV
ncbi:helicase-associated domain-containing protein [Citricoccus sp. NPDC079358]|uniref:helicase-associated domain-containing protein n=1 Tax=Citricoccus sp. NPDC079358 TaxID=3154653 RepID=UPI00344F81C2